MIEQDGAALVDLDYFAIHPGSKMPTAADLRMILTQLRVRRTAMYRRAYTAAAVGLAYAAASLAFHAVVPALGPGAGTGTGDDG